MTVYYYDDLTFEEYAEEIAGYENCTAPEQTLINGYRTFTYKNTEYDTFNVVLAAGKDCMESTFWPASDADFYSLITYMSASIMDA